MYLKENCQNIDLPFLNHFPQNCCEIASLILGAAILESLDREDAYLVEGYNHEENEHHFWIEYQSVKLDVTEEQFFKTNIENLNKYFPQTGKISISQCFTENSIWLHHSVKIKNIAREICSTLNS